MNNDLLISIDSFAILPSVPESAIRSLPAKSTNYSFETVSWAPSAENVLTVIVKIVWDLDDDIFNLCEAVIRFLTPAKK